MIGNMSGKLAGAIGEGASDVNAFLNSGDDRIGEYAYGDPLGIRRYPYSNFPLTYSAVTGAEVHNDGEIYAGAMWRVLQNYLAAGLPSDTLYHDFVDGMNYTPAAPAFEDMRDGMLQSAAGTGRECLIWRGFATAGIGVGADGKLSASGALTILESFALPASCQ
jgi:extracellular elastinolytic metalloproteinase